MGNVFVLGRCIVQFRESKGNITVLGAAKVKGVQESAGRQAAKLTATLARKVSGEGPSFSLRTNCVVRPQETVVVDVEAPHLEELPVVSVEEEQDIVVPQHVVDVSPHVEADNNIRFYPPPSFRHFDNVFRSVITNVEVHSPPRRNAAATFATRHNVDVVSPLGDGNLADAENSIDSEGYEDANGTWSK